ncbi:MAG: hypothetical protein WCF24_10205, partial [Acidimicrobiales bacterium]
EEALASDAGGETGPAAEDEAIGVPEAPELETGVAGEAGGPETEAEDVVAAAPAKKAVAKKAPAKKAAAKLTAAKKTPAEKPAKKTVKAISKLAKKSGRKPQTKDEG